MLSSDEAARMLRTVAELAGGSFEESEDSEQRIKITLPLSEEKSTVNELTTEPSPNPRILHLESDEDSDDLVSYYLQSRFSVETVHSVADTLKRALTKVYTFIILDIESGRNTNALELAAILRKSDGLTGTPIIAITNYTTRGEMKRCLSSGCTAVVTRPFVKEDLLAVLQELDETKRIRI